MSRREYTIRRKCSWEGCNELALNFAYDRASDYREELSRYNKQNNYCIRHKNPDEVLTTENRHITFQRTYTAEVADEEKYPNLHKQGIVTFGNTGFIYGDGWKAWSNDFPEGTKIRVSVEVTVELPE